VTGSLILSITFYLLLLVVLISLLACVVPFPPFASRARAATTATVALGAAAIVLLIPSPRQRIGSDAMLIDRFMPEYDYFEHHETRIRASRADVFRAIEEVRPSEIPLFLLLTSIRRLKPAPYANGSERPLLEISKAGGFIELARENDREIVQGTVGQFWRMRARRPDPPVRDVVSFAAPPGGFAKATINFLLVEEADGTRLITETRILCPDRDAKRWFTPYWRVILPGSALIRVMWLDSIRQKAEGGRQK
jgi:hypothetical protein